MNDYETIFDIFINEGYPQDMAEILTEQQLEYERTSNE